MSDVLKWTLLIAAAAAVIALIVGLPFLGFIDGQAFAEMIDEFVSLAGGAFQFGRGLINNFLTPFGRSCLSGILFWIIGKWVITFTIKAFSWATHFLFK